VLTRHRRFTVSAAFTSVPRLIRRGVNLAPVRKREAIIHRLVHLGRNALRTPIADVSATGASVGRSCSCSLGATSKPLRTSVPAKAKSRSQHESPTMSLHTRLDAPL